ncbi:MAG: type II toxin-antitoxin system PemK/MazF family toxin [Dethiobacteraceae bacterium]
MTVLNVQSYVKTKDIRAVSVQRLIKAVGQISPGKLEEVEICLRRILSHLRCSGKSMNRLF